MSMKISSSPVALVCYSAPLSILNSPIILHVWHLISSWPLTPKAELLPQDLVPFEIQIPGAISPAQELPYGDRPPLAWQCSVCTTGPTVIVQLAYLMCRKSIKVWPITALQLRHISHFTNLNDLIVWPVSMKYHLCTKFYTGQYIPTKYKK